MKRNVCLCATNGTFWHNIGMKANEGSTDRYLRLALGMVLFALALMFPQAGFLTTLFWILGTLMVVTGFMGFCLIYQLLGMNTCKR